jgi:hypothetical protein
LLRQVEGIQCALGDVCDLDATDADKIVNDDRSELSGGVNKELIKPAIIDLPAQRQDR